ncbi:glycosyltransferase family 2 protein [Massilia sp. S19_KUP03_FR1]|uniref:glycosyltransferase family 2 protein n=1 Tax=Massilia sp. S19_KUP03_FR1 TaxID=3025503 RepID=UPI002FCCFAC6
MPPEPLFSIVTCTWNSAATLPATLASLRAQTWRDVEHVFVDGGSTDATLALLNDFRANKRVLHDVRGGISHAMNCGIAAASGTFVAHLHADDYYAAPDVLEQVAAALQSSGRDWLVGEIAVLAGEVLLPPRARRAYSYHALASGRAFVPHPATFVRRGLFEQVGLFDEQLRYAMDIDLWLRLAARTPPVLLQRVLAVFRDHPGSVSSANKLLARQEEWRVRRRYAAQAPLAFALYCLRYLKRTHALRQKTVSEAVLSKQSEHIDN